MFSLAIAAHVTLFLPKVRKARKGEGDYQYLDKLSYPIVRRVLGPRKLGKKMTNPARGVE